MTHGNIFLKLLLVVVKGSLPNLSPNKGGSEWLRPTTSLSPIWRQPLCFFRFENQASIEAVKAKYDIPDGPYLLSLSTLEPRKNIALTIDAFTIVILQEKLNDLHLVLVGTKGWKFDAIFEKIKEQPSVEKRIIFTVYVADEDLAALYSGSMMFAYPSLYEGFGLPALEAMQYGVPVIGSPCKTVQV